MKDLYAIFQHNNKFHHEKYLRKCLYSRGHLAKTANHAYLTILLLCFFFRFKQVERLDRFRRIQVLLWYDFDGTIRNVRLIHRVRLRQVFL